MLVCNNCDNTIRWKKGERLDHLFEEICDSLELEGKPDHPAVITDGTVISFRELDNRANQTARYLIKQGIWSGDRVGLLFDKSVETYVALLAVLKVNAAYVPFDGSFPSDRIAFILEDAGVKSIVSQSVFAQKLSDFQVPAIFVDEAKEEISKLDENRLSNDEKGAPADEVSYLIYTSGTTGKPKGVVIEHASICNFVRVAAETYGYGPDDRVYQGMTIAFDFSVEELWVPLLAGSALVPGKPGTSLVGADLADYLEKNKVTGLACVPTLLATIEKDLPDLRLLIVSGEACPQNLVQRWSRPGRTILNAYGPTEATVTCTLTELIPDKPVTIGGPLPTYTIVILDPDNPETVGNGELGEIGIAGVGLAQGYLNRPELTAEKFIPDFLNLPNNPSKRIYRSGDLGRINEIDEVEFHGRIDTQVKIRGYRIELTEIESILMEFPQIAQAVVDTYEPEPGAVELVAYYALNEGETGLKHEAITDVLRARLPRYMVPAYIEELPIIPMTSSNKADRKNLPAPKNPRFVSASNEYFAPQNETEETLAGLLAKIMEAEKISVQDDFFNDLGAHSLLMAQFSAAVRERIPSAVISMRDIYLNPTVSKLAGFLNSLQDDGPRKKTTRESLHIPSKFEYYGCGALQLSVYVASGLFGLWILLTGFHWTYEAIGHPLELYFRLIAFLVLAFVGLSASAIAAKWLLIGTWKEETLPIWSIRYFRFWLAKALIRSSPMSLFLGTPIYNVYLRLLGAKIGKNVVIGSRAPVCADMFAVGDNSIVRNGSFLPGYKAQSNYIQAGPIHIGANAFVGTASVLDINTVMEDNTQLGHSSCLQSGQRIPDGMTYHGTPAEKTTTNYCSLEKRDCSSLRRWLYPVILLAITFALVPVPIFILYNLFPYLHEFTSAANLNYNALGSVILALAPKMLLISLVLLFGFLLIGLIAVYIIPRIFNSFLQEGKTYVLFGVHYFVQGIVSATSNSGFYNLLFGDSSYIVNYLKLVGYNLNEIIQTGANFGLDQVHDNPFLCDIGSGTMVSDGLAMANVEMSNSSFKLGKVKIGDHNYLGNNIYFPAASKTGANCLLATKVMIPVDGPVRENTGLLGSPCFEIPRVAERDRQLADIDKNVLMQKIGEKNRWNLMTIAIYLSCAWLFFFFTLLSAYLSILYYPILGAPSLIALVAFVALFSLAFFVLMERASLGFKTLQPKIVSMYDQYFWFHERHWKLTGHPLMFLFNGTPFKSVISRLLGIKIGKMVFDDGANLFDKTLIEIGDYSNLNVASVLQGHSLEEGAFKSDRIKIGSGSSIHCGAFVHYGVNMGENVVLGPNAFLMKGETLPPNTNWEGNPAREV